MSSFKITKGEIDEIFSTYQRRTQNEEISHINNKHKGISNLGQLLQTDFKNGISSDLNSLKFRESTFDSNIRYREPMPSFWFFICDAWGDEILRILIICAIIEISIGVSPLSENPKKDWIDGMAIVFAIIVIVITTSVTNYKKEQKFKNLSDENFKRFQVVVTRGGVKTNISDEELLVGDICKIDMGMLIPADGVFIDGSNLRVDESSWTGESKWLRKDTVDNCLAMQNNVEGKNMPSPLLFSGTTVKEGWAKMLVLAVGKNSAAGKIREKVMQNKNDESDNQTPLQLKLGDIADDIGKFGLWSAIFTLIALLIKLFWSKYKQLQTRNEMMEQFIENKFPNGTYVNETSESINNSTFYLIDNNSVWSGIWKEIFQSIILCITIIVVAIPEGLPLAVTLSLSFSVKKMMDDNNLVRHMNACETMGGANYICTDKTGTLTRNKMHVVKIFNNSVSITVDEIESDHKAKPTDKFNEKYYTLLRNALLNNLSIELDSDNNIIMESSSKTDFSFYDLLKGFGEDFSTYQTKVDCLGFHSDRKKMSTICRVNKRYFIYMKGAPEVVISSCTKYLLPDGETENDIDDNYLRKFEAETKRFSGLTLRNLAIAYKEINQKELNHYLESKATTSHLNYEIEKDKFTLIGVAAIYDGLRPGVMESVKQCHSAHVRVIMITGDDERIADAIAKSAGIINDKEDYMTLTGQEFMNRIGGLICTTCTWDSEKCECPKTLGQAREKYGEDNSDSYLEDKLKKEKIKNMDEFKAIAKKLRVIARARANDKFALVLGLREWDNVVSVTGDGTNDAPALSKADVGFAMGKCGTDVARDAADIIILDDDFNSIIHAIKWGRNIFDNIRKFIQFQLSVNISAVLLVFICSCIGSESPITAIQMLWINWIMDSLGSLALATEDPSNELLNRKPYGKREYIISPIMWKHIIFQSLVQFSLVFGLYLFAPHFIPEDHPERLNMIQQFENCFGDFVAEESTFKGHQIIHYIIDGKKSSWNPLVHIRRNLDPKVCLFYNTELFDESMQITNLFEAFKWYTTEYGNTCHMTIIFNTFVLYSLFNQINSRVIDDTLNIFKRMFGNWWFISVTGVEWLCQFIIVQYGGLIFKCAVGGLTLSQWGWCVGLSSITFLVSFIVKCIPFEKLFTLNYKKWCCCCRNKSQEETYLLEEEEDEFDKANIMIEMKEDGKNSSSAQRFLTN